MAGILIEEKSGDVLRHYPNVVGYALVAVIVTEDGGLNIERDLATLTGNAQDGPIVSDFLKEVDKALAPLFPAPSDAEPKIWVPE